MRSAAVSLAALVLAALLAGCNFTPPYTRPSAPVAPLYPVTGDDAATATAPFATDRGWREFFTDPRLQTLIEVALERNRDLAQSYARIEQARAQYRIRESQRLPNVGANGGATRSRQPLSTLGAAGALPDSGGDDGGGDSDSDTDGDAPTSIDITQYSANVGVSSFELDLWGRVRNLAAADRERYLSSIEGARAFRLSLIAQVASTYFDIRAGEERMTLAEQTLEGRREGARIAKLRLDAGVTSTVDHDQAVLLLTQAQTEQAEIQRTAERARNLLQVLIGGPLDIALPDGAELTGQVREIEPGLPARLLADRPDILQAEHQLKAANANIGAARAAFFPSISLTGNYGFASTELGELFQDASRSWSFGGSLNLPIFDWGQRQAQLRLGKAQADELVAAYQRTVQGAFQEVSDALVGRQRYAEQIAAQTQTLEAQRRLARTARLRYDNGIAIYLEVLDAERQLFSAGQQLIQLRATELQNAVSLYIALGGGSTERAGEAN